MDIFHVIVSFFSIVTTLHFTKSGAVILSQQKLLILCLIPCLYRCLIDYGKKTGGKITLRLVVVTQSVNPSSIWERHRQEDLLVQC